MDKGIFSWFGYLLPMQDRFALIRDAGFQTVMLWWGGEFDPSPGEYLEHPALAERFGLRVENAHLPYFTCKELWTGGGYERLLLDGIRSAADRGVPTLVAHISEDEASPEPNQRGLDTILRAAELCEKTGVRLALENVRERRRLDYVLSRVDSPMLGFCYDIGHARFVTGRDHQLLRDYGRRLTALHLHDNDGTDDQHRLPFDGNVDWNGFASILPSTSYRGSLTLEVDPLNWEDPDRISADAYLALAFERACRIEALITHDQL